MRLLLTLFLMGLSLEAAETMHIPAVNVRPTQPQSQTSLKPLLEAAESCTDLSSAEKKANETLRNLVSSFPNRRLTVEEEFGVVRGVAYLEHWDTEFCALVHKLLPCVSTKSKLEKELWQRLDDRCVVSSVKKRATPQGKVNAWLIDVDPSTLSEDPTEGMALSGDQRKTLLPGKGLVPLEPGGELPRNRLILQFDPSANEYTMLLCTNEGELIPFEDHSLGNSGLLVGLENSIRFVPLLNSGRDNDAKYFRVGIPELHLLFYRLDQDSIRRRDRMPSTERSIKALAEAREKPLAFVLGKMSVGRLEEEFEVGTFNGDEPLRYVWMDPSQKTFSLVDENLKVAYRQFSENGDLKLQRLRILGTDNFTGKAGAHYVVKSTALAPSGLDEKVRNEIDVKHGWFVEDSKGRIFRLEENPESDKGVLHLPQNEATLKPVWSQPVKKKP